ncbi:hypothetical protein B0H14DRAFT_3456813 [Mycena olivaceomarginata]|nr:hypothetical protein B0H14DRAFT_3456813 [Mycena olivaceomarginata]
MSRSDLPHRDAPACIATPRPASRPPRRPPRTPANFAALALIDALRTPYLSSCPAPPRCQTVPPLLPSPLRAGAFVDAAAIMDATLSNIQCYACAAVDIADVDMCRPAPSTSTP